MTTLSATTAGSCGPDRVVGDLVEGVGLAEDEVGLHGDQRVGVEHAELLVRQVVPAALLAVDVVGARCEGEAQLQQHRRHVHRTVDPGGDRRTGVHGRGVDADRPLALVSSEFPQHRPSSSRSASIRSAWLLRSNASPSAGVRSRSSSGTTISSPPRPWRASRAEVVDDELVGHDDVGAEAGQLFEVQLGVGKRLDALSVELVEPGEYSSVICTLVVNAAGVMPGPSRSASRYLWREGEAVPRSQPRRDSPVVPA